MAYGVLISNNVGSRKSVAVFDSRNPAHIMPQLLKTHHVTAGSSGSFSVPLPESNKNLSEVRVASYPDTNTGGLPNLYYSNGTVTWDYTEVESPTAVTIAVFT